ncbi:ubiquitin-related domain-containing protein [Gilbertella persicaria]|uniref:ubiquitin-related domain-containing protein n=1 Tax=Gilbertella persicaria TaxID=101096 RepID=UPI00221F6A82|nr:ubiquitin-related domain-containing protein [Gilbertella persicaria]KAI8067677.1 ubiquitin-related domain-containing protein [Gilbertella persicaria]
MTYIWFSGPVVEAVKQVNERNLVFLVYIYDDSEHSKHLDATFQNAELLDLLKRKAIALKLKKDSEDAKMFGQLYPIYRVPIVYFIAQGTIKDFGTQDMRSQDIINKLQAASPKSDAKTKLEEIKKKRAEQENLQAREREIKRREDGKLAQETRESLQEKQNKIMLEKKKKEKKEEEEYRKRVKEQIAKDRENQQAARKTEKERLQNKAKEETPIQKTVSSSGLHHFANLNIKQLDGSSLKHRFSSSNTLAHVCQWIEATRTDGDMPFKLFVQFPNRNFDIGDEQRTLLELKLCPSSTLIMKPIKNASTAYAGSPSSNSGWMSYLYQTSDAIYNSVAQVGTSIASYLSTPEAEQRLGNRSSSQHDTSSH